jgi:hypothetical protein
MPARLQTDIQIMADGFLGYKLIFRSFAVRFLGYRLIPDDAIWISRLEADIQIMAV